MKIQIKIIWTRLSTLAFFTAGILFSPPAAHARYYDPEVGRFTSADTVVPSAMDPQALNRYAYVRNNPTVLTDPSGNKWGLSNVWNKIGNLVRTILSPPPRQPSSGTEENRPDAPSGDSGIPGLPNQPKSDLRSIVAVQQTPILLSGPTTVLTWGVMDSLSDRLLGSGEYSRFASRFYGHSASEKEKRGLAAALNLGVSYGYNKIAGYQPKNYKGRGYSEKSLDADSITGLEAGRDGFNNFGVAHMGAPRKGRWEWDEGGSLSRFFNNVYGINAISGVHDRFQVHLEQHGGPDARIKWNFPGMPLAAGVTYPALLWQPIWLFESEY